MQKTIIIVLCFLSAVQIMFAQGEIDDEQKIFFRDESTFAGMLNTNGFGGNYRYARRQNAFKSTIYDFDFVRLKSNKEKKPGSQSTGNYVYGQINSLSTLRAGLGFRKEMYSKQDKGSITIRYFYSGGLSLGLEKPVYYVGDSPDYIQFDVNQHLSAGSLGGKAPFYVGMNELNPVPGGFAKFGYCFEYSDNDRFIKALETAVVLDVFYRPVEIMATHKSMFYFGFVMAYRFGKAVDKQAIRSNRKIDNIVDFR